MDYKNSGLMEIFCRYFNEKNNEYKTYNDFLLWIKKNYSGVEHLTERNIKSLGWNLNRNNILVAKRVNDGITGLFSTKRSINTKILREKFDINIED